VWKAPPASARPRPGRTALGFSSRPPLSRRHERHAKGTKSFQCVVLAARRRCPRGRNIVTETRNTATSERPSRTRRRHLRRRAKGPPSSGYVRPDAAGQHQAVTPSRERRTREHAHRQGRSSCSAVWCRTSTHRGRTGSHRETPGRPAPLADRGRKYTGLSQQRDDLLEASSTPRREDLQGAHGPVRWADAGCTVSTTLRSNTDRAKPRHDDEETRKTPTT